MNANIKYDSRKHSYNDVLQSREKGINFLCPVCQSKLLIINSKSLVSQHKKPQGIFCPKNDNHVWIKFILTEERGSFWKKVENRIKNNSENETRSN